MAAQPGYKTRVLAGSLHISGSIRSASASMPYETLDVSTLTDGANKAFIPKGQKGGGSFTCDGPLDTSNSSNAPWPVLTAWRGTNIPITYFPSGASTALDEAWLLDGVNSDFSVTTQLNGTVDYSLTATQTGPVVPGILLEPLTAVTTTANGASRNDVAASSNGGVFHLHVTAFATLTSNTVTVEHSTNGSTGWTAVATFTAATGVTYQRVQTTGTINQYLRVVDTVVGSGSCTRAVAYARL
jgi:hypothetical protein